MCHVKGQWWTALLRQKQIFLIFIVCKPGSTSFMLRNKKAEICIFLSSNLKFKWFYSPLNEKRAEYTQVMFPWLPWPLLLAGHSNSVPSITTTYNNLTWGQSLKYQYLREWLLFLLRVQSTIRHSQRVVAADWYCPKLHTYVTASRVLLYCFL